MRKRRTKKYTARRVSYRKAPKRRAKRTSGMKGEMMTAISAGAYGAVRARMSNMLAPYTSKIPAGNLSDEVGMILALHFGKKFIGRKVPMLNGVFKAGKIIEYARLGEALATGQAGLGNNASNGRITQTIY